MSLEHWKPGFALQLFRKIRGLSREQLAKQSGVSAVVLRRAERGREMLQLEELYAVTHALEFDLVDIELLFLYCQQLTRTHLIADFYKKTQPRPRTVKAPRQKQRQGEGVGEGIASKTSTEVQP